MKVRVIGKERKMGDYEGNKYDNTYLHCITNDFLPSGFEGLYTSVLKFKTALIPSNLTLDSVIDVQYNAYGKVIDLKVVGKE